MLKPFSYIILILFTTAINSHCYAQYDEENYEFTPGDKVIFSDDFSHDSVGAFPAHWHIASCDKNNLPDHSDRKLWSVEKDGNEHALLIKKTDAFIDPNINIQYYLHDSFTVDFDFLFEGVAGCAELCFYSYENPDPCVKAFLHIVSSGQLRKSNFPVNSSNLPLGQYPAPFDRKIWHHFALAYKERAIDFYIDKYRVASLPDCGFSPSGVSLSCIAPVRYKHFRITTGKENTNFSKILTEKKFVTHAINFDVNRSTIKPQSIEFITQLAQFLKANPTIKLEIDGHTDSDGDAELNRKLSFERANEVRKQLVSMGIDGSRLTTNGFGASKPIQPNTTEEGKANNRRVEFIKM